MNYRSSYINYDFPKLIRNSGFAFDEGKNKSRVNWNDIRVIDINKLIDERDFSTVDKHINEVLNCQLNIEFNVDILDSGFVKLFRLAQLTVEYLLECRRHLDLIAMTLKADAVESTEKMANLKTQLNTKETELKKLQYKTRKRYSSTKEKNHLGFSNVLKNLISNSDGEHNSAGLNKCSYCSKIFINIGYLQSHVIRRHSNHVTGASHFTLVDNLHKNDTQSHNLTEKLNLEIKELKEKLNLAEKQNIFEQNRSVDDHIEDLDFIEPGEKMHTEMKNVEIESSAVFQHLTQKNDATVEMFEELKQKQADYHSELMQIKSQLLENINELKIKSDCRLIENTSGDDLTAIIERHEIQLNNIKTNIDERAMQNLKDVKSQIENQEMKLDQKLNSIEMKHSQLIENVQANILKHLNDFHNVQQMYQSKITQLENTALEQKRATEEQTKQIIEITKETNKIISEISSQNTYNKNKFNYDKSESQCSIIPIVTESQETLLPPYEEKSKIKTPHVSKKIISPAKYESDDDSVSDLSDNISPDIKKPQIDTSNGHKVLLKTQKQSNVAKKINEQKKNKSGKTNKESEYDQNKKTNRQKNKTNKYSDSMLRALEKKPDLEKVIKTDLTTMFKRRLENLGINADSKTLTLDNYRKSMQILEEKQNLMEKKYKGYRRIQRNIIKEIDDKVDSSKGERQSPLPNVKQNKPLRLMESIINKVKTLNITKSRSLTGDSPYSTKDDGNVVDAKKKLSAKSILAMIDTDLSNTRSNDKQPMDELDSSSVTSDVESDTDLGKTIVTTAISHLPTNNIDELLLSPIRKLNAASPIVVKGFQTSSPIQSDDALLTNGNSKVFLERKSYSADNINKRNLHASPKGVLKTVSSANSLSKKKVNFDLDANEMKSFSSEDSSDSMIKPVPVDSSNSAINLKVSDDTTKDRIEKKPDNEFAFTNEEIQQIQVSTKQSPKIAEIASAIESKLGSRLNINPPAGGIEAMFQAKSIQEKPENTNVIAKDIINIDSDMDISDWSIDELLNAK